MENLENQIDASKSKHVIKKTICKICGYDSKNTPGRHMKNHHPGLKFQRLTLEDPYPDQENAFCENLEGVLDKGEKPVKPKI